jgi:hypothetical protein
VLSKREQHDEVPRRRNEIRSQAAQSMRALITALAPQPNTRKGKEAVYSPIADFSDTTTIIAD